MINNIIYFKTHTTSDEQIFACFKIIMFKVALFNSPQKILPLFSCVSNFTLLGFLVGTMIQDFSDLNLI